MKTPGLHRILIIGLLILFVVVGLRTAWVCDDAYITFRTVNNFIAGDGLTWNPGERVQAYTHPLWMLVLSLCFWITHEEFITTIVVSLALSVTTLLLLAQRLAGSLVGAWLALLILTCSKAFTDFSTSGLENPLTHLLLALFLLVFLMFPFTPRALFFLSLLASLGALSRMDLLLIYGPLLFYALLQLRRRLGFYAVIWGGWPLIAWECFSLCYYGFLFPNTAYAKLNTGLDGAALAVQGVIYLRNSFQMDPLTLLVIASSVSVALLTRTGRNLAIAAGIILYLLYIVKIGGDFMTGRFLSAPLLVSLALLISFPSSPRARMWFSVGVVGALAVGLGLPHSPLFSGASYGPPVVDDHGITDERAFYFQMLGLFPANPNRVLPRWSEGFDSYTPWVQELTSFKVEVLQRWAEQEGPHHPVVLTTTTGAIGVLGFQAGRTAYIVDYYALSDPLLARLPSSVNPKLRIGHFGRCLPTGYVETLASHQNKLKDPNLARYYDQLSLITRGSLFEPQRWSAIWDLNTGHYDDLIQADRYRYPDQVTCISVKD
jgi:arabinofuranosyltransferase